MKFITVAGTGHRPEKLGGYSDQVLDRLTALAYAYLVRVEANHVISGMALGWDTALCIAALDLGLPVTTAIPFRGQEHRWPHSSKKMYYNLLSQCAETVVVSSGGYSAASMQRRNIWMVNHCDRIVALWDGSSGGTGNCIQYADKVGCPYDNVWKSWVKYSGVAA